MDTTLLRFNACKRAIGALLVKHDRELSDSQKSALSRAWQSWSIIDRVGRARARKLIQEALGDLACETLEQLKQFDKEQKAT